MNTTDVKKTDNIITLEHVTFQYNKEEEKSLIIQPYHNKKSYIQYSFYSFFNNLKSN